MLRRIEQGIGESLQVLCDRVRASALRWRGAHLGSRTRVGASCVIRRPWRLVVGERTQFEHQVHIKITGDDAEIRLGQEVFVGFNCEFDVSVALWIGDNVLIAPGCFITDHGHMHAADRLISAQGCESLPVRIDADVWLGAKVIVLPGVTIGRGAIVAAGAVVNRDVESMTIVAGVPARPIGNRT